MGQIIELVIVGRGNDTDILSYGTLYCVSIDAQTSYADNSG